MARQLSKGEFLIALDTEAIPFITFMTITDNTNPLFQLSKSFNFMWEATDYIDWDSNLMQNILLPLLISNSVIDQTAITLVDDYIIANIASPP